MSDKQQRAAGAHNNNNGSSNGQQQQQQKPASSWFPSLPSFASTSQQVVPQPQRHIGVLPIDDDPQTSSGGPYRLKEPWTLLALDNLRGFGLQLVCAGGAGALAKTAVAPLERVKILLQVQQMSAAPKDQQYTGLRDALRRIPKQEGGGWRALYRGNGANVARLVPDVAFKFAVHDQLRLMFAPPDGSPPGVGEKAAAGAATGILRTLCCYPLDLCRTRLTADTTPAGAERPYRGIASCLRHAWATGGGPRAWYRGMGLSLPGVVVYTGASFAAYDSLRAALPTDKASKEALWYPLAKIGAGAAAGVAAQTASYPLDTLRRRMQVSGAPGMVTYRGYWSVLRHMAAPGGGGLLRGLFRGWGIACLKTAPGAAVQFVAYDLLRLGVTSLDPSSGAVSPL